MVETITNNQSDIAGLLKILDAQLACVGTLDDTRKLRRGILQTRQSLSVKLSRLAKESDQCHAFLGDATTAETLRLTNKFRDFVERSKLLYKKHRKPRRRRRHRHTDSAGSTPSTTFDESLTPSASLGGGGADELCALLRRPKSRTGTSSYDSCTARAGSTVLTTPGSLSERTIRRKMRGRDKKSKKKKRVKILPKSAERCTRAGQKVMLPKSADGYMRVADFMKHSFDENVFEEAQEEIEAIDEETGAGFSATETAMKKEGPFQLQKMGIIDSEALDRKRRREEVLATRVADGFEFEAATRKGSGPRVTAQSVRVFDDESLLEERRDSMRGARTELTLMRPMFDELHSLVDAQQSVMDVLEEHVDETHQFAKSGAEQLEQSEAKARKRRRRRCFFALCLTVFLLVLILVCYLEYAQD